MNVLGISPLDKDATASLVVGGKVVFAAAEERFFVLAETQQVYEIVHISYLPDGTAIEYREDVLPTHQWVMHYEWNAENDTTGGGTGR